MPSKKTLTSMWSSDEFWASPYNFDKTITNRPNLPSKIIIHDTTLRDGEQTREWYSRQMTKWPLQKLLDEIGVDRIEAGMPAVSMDNKEAIQAIIDLGLEQKYIAVALLGKGKTKVISIWQLLGCGWHPHFCSHRHTEAKTSIPRSYWGQYYWKGNPIGLLYKGTGGKGNLCSVWR